MASFRTAVMDLIDRQPALDTGSSLAAMDRAIAQAVEHLGALVQARQVLLTQLEPPKPAPKGKRKVPTG